MKIFSKSPRHIVLSLIWGKNFQHIWLYVKVFFANFIAALLEGASFAFLFLSLSVMNQNSFEVLRENVFFQFFRLSKLVAIFNAQELFVIFILTAIVLQALRSIGTWIAQYTTAVLTAKIQSEMQSQICKKIFTFSFTKVNQYRSGDLIDYVKHPSMCVQVVMEHMNIFMISSLMIFGSLMIMLSLSSQLTILTFFLFALSGLVQKIFFKKISMYSKQYTDCSVYFSNEVIQNINGIRIQHIFNKTGNTLKKISKLLTQTANAQKKLGLWNGVLVSYNETVSVLIVGIILTFGVFLIKQQKEFILPMLLTFLGLSHRIATRVQLIFKAIGSITSNYGNIFRIANILQEKDPYQKEVKAKQIHSFNECIQYENVSIVYPNNKEKSLSNFTYTFKKGKTIALVGPSGAGKSTIIDLLLGLYTPTYGEILIDGQALSSFDIKSWRDILGVVSQDIFIYHDTIEENIRFGSEKITQEAIKTAAKEAGAHDFIDKLPDGYKTMLGEKGYRLSGGEKQRIALARALIRNPNILILDEATSNLDSYSEKLIQDTIERNQHQRTIIVIAHRLSTIIHSDEILVIKGGQLVENGRHEALLQKDGYYAYLWNLQSSKNMLKLSV